MQSMQVSGTNQDNGLPYVCWNHLPGELRENFKGLFQNDGGVVLYYFAVVHKIGRKIVPQKRVLMITHSAVWQCMATCEVNRCAKIQDISEVLVTSENWLGIKVSGEYDMLLIPTSKESMKAFLHVFRVVYKQLAKKEPKITTLPDSKNIKSMLNLKKPSGFETGKQLFVLKRDVWRAHYRRQRIASAAADSGKLDQPPPASPVNMETLAAPSTNDLVQLAPPGADSPAMSPSNSPSHRGSPSPIPLITQTEPTPRHSERSARAIESPLTPTEVKKDVEEQSIPTQIYGVGDLLEIRRSTGWESCVVFTIENSSYVVSTTKDEKKQVFFHEAATYLRLPTFDAYGDPLKPGCNVKLLRSTTHQDSGLIIPKDTPCVVTALLGPDEEDADDMFIDVRTPTGCVVKVKSEDVEFVDTLGDVNAVPVVAAPVVEVVAAPIEEEEKEVVQQQQQHLDAYQERLRSMREHSPSVSPSPSPMRNNSPSPRGSKVAEEPSPPPPPPPPPPPEPTPDLAQSKYRSLPEPGSPDVTPPRPSPTRDLSSLSDASPPIDHHASPQLSPSLSPSQGMGSLYSNSPVSPPPAPSASPAREHTPSASPQGETSPEHAKPSLSGMSSPGTPHSFSQSTVHSPEKVKAEFGVAQLLASGDFGKLGDFVSTLCEEYRRQVAGLHEELERKTQYCESLESRLRQTGDASLGRRSEDPALKASYLEHELQKSEDMVRILRSELSTKDSEEVSGRDDLVAELEKRHSVLQQMILEKEEEAFACKLLSNDLEKKVAESNETTSFLKSKIIELETENLRLKEQTAGRQSANPEAQRHIEDLEEQVLALEIANEAKQTDALLLREAIVLAERRADTAEQAYNGTGPGTKRVVDMSADELQVFLREVLKMSPETCRSLEGVHGEALMSMPPEDLSRRLQHEDLSVLFKVLNISEEEVRRSVTPSVRGLGSLSPQVGDGDEMKELLKVAWILSSRSRMVEKIWRGYEMVTATRSQITSAHWNLMKGDTQDATAKIASAESALSRVEGAFKGVVTEYFMDFEKHHLGISGHKLKERGRSRSPRRESKDLKVSLRMSPTERRLLARLTSSLYMNSSVKAVANDKLYTAALPCSMSRSPQRRRSLTPDKGEGSRTVSPASSAGAMPRSAFEQIMYLTPPTAMIHQEPPKASPPKKRTTSLKRRPTQRASPTPRQRTQSPNVAFGRSALPRPDSPNSRRRTDSSEKSYSLNGRRVQSGGGATRGRDLGRAHYKREEIRDQSTSVESYPESGPLSGWQTSEKSQKKASHLYPFGRT